MTPTVAYFSMEIAVDPALPTYAGGLGALAGDTIRAAADAQVPLLAVTLLHRQGYFAQSLDSSGWQLDAPVEWTPERLLTEMPPRVTVTLRNRIVEVRCWRYDVRGVEGGTVPVFFLDTDLPSNGDRERALTHHLYGGDAVYRLCQEAVLGIGGVRMLRALGFRDLARFHMNEGHSSLLALELLEERLRGGGRRAFEAADLDAVRRLCVFTTHTPVPAGHDQFPLDLVRSVLGDHILLELRELCCYEGALNLTHLALNFSRYVNGVSMEHGEVSRHLFAGYKVDAITNGIHVATWAAGPIAGLFDRHIPGWRLDNFSLRYALSLPDAEIWDAHMEAKRQLIARVNAETGIGMSPEAFTLGFGRRAATYKRADLLFHDVGRLTGIAARGGPLQVVYAGKAHPRDDGGKQIIQHIVRLRDALEDRIKIAYLENYDMTLARAMTAGVDLWLNTPQPPLEASGTSGMKAALNGVPSLSVLDGWWVEGHIEGITGWAIRSDPDAPDRARDAALLYDALERVVLPLFARDRAGWVAVMRHAIALNGSFFTTQRMLQEYVLKAYGQDTV